MTQAVKLVVYIGEADHHAGRPLYDVILHTLQNKGITGASAFRGIAGYGGHGVMHTTAILRLSEDLPIRIEAIDTPGKIDAVLPEILSLVGEGLVETERVEVHKFPPLQSERGKS